jgi:hypothetical protein
MAAKIQAVIGQYGCAVSTKAQEVLAEPVDFMSARDANVDAVREKLRKRSIVGQQKYGLTTERKDLSSLDWLIHLQEELMDAAVYIEAANSHPQAQQADKVLALIAKWRENSTGTKDRHWDEPLLRSCADELEAALGAKPTAER